MAELIESELGVFDDFEDFLDAVRIKNYEETKHMTYEQRAALINARTEPIIKKFGIKTANLPPVERNRYVPNVAEQTVLSEAPSR